MSEKEKMLAGVLYDPADPELGADRRRARLLMKAYNDTSDADTDERLRLLAEFVPVLGRNVQIEPPFYCEYGTNLHLGDDVFFNFNCVVLDVATVHVGSRVLVGPSVQIYTATHTMDAGTRRTGLEYARPIAIEEDVWIAGGVILCAGVTIGARSVIGAGSVVTRDVPADVFAAGNPCRVIRALVGAR